VYVFMGLAAWNKRLIDKHTLLVGLHCCSKWFEGVSSRISKFRANRGFVSQRDVVHPLWIGDHQGWCRAAGRRRDQNHLCSIHSSISLRHRSKFRHISGETLHRWSVRARWRLVRNYTRNKEIVDSRLYPGGAFWRTLPNASRLTSSWCRHLVNFF